MAPCDRVKCYHRHRIGIYSNCRIVIEFVAGRDDEDHAGGGCPIHRRSKRQVHRRSAERHVDHLRTDGDRSIYGARDIVIVVGASLVGIRIGAGAGGIGPQHQQCSTKGYTMGFEVILGPKEYRRNGCPMTAFVLQSATACKVC